MLQKTTEPRPSLKGLLPVLLGAAIVASLASPLSGATLTVDTLEDETTVDGDCTLREAIESANGDIDADDCGTGSGADVIEFSVAGTITLGSLLPIVTDTVEIDGYTAPGASANTLPTATDAVLTVVLDAGANSQALRVDAPNSRVRGLVVQNFSAQGIRLLDDADGSQIDGNFVGTTADGTAASGNADGAGILVASGADSVVIGGPDPANRNLLSGNMGPGLRLQGISGASVEGNLVGTDATGMSSVPNATGQAPNGPGIALNPGSSSNRIVGNLISGNAGDGIQTFHDSSLNSYEGNWIGVDATGNGPLPNARHGIVFWVPSTGLPSSSENEIVGNVVSAHPRKGIALDGDAFVDTLVQGNLLGVGADGETALGNGFGPDPTGMGLGPDPAIDILREATATVSDNIILNNAIGVLVRNDEFDDSEPTPGMLLPESDMNCIVFNDEGVINTTGIENSFEQNWWGSSDGPSGAGPGHGDSTSEDIDFTPWLASAPRGCPTAVSLLEIPTADTKGLVLLGLLLAASGFLVIRRFAP